MPDPIAPASAPAETVTASQAAVAADDFSTFREAERAEGKGKPLPPVAVAPEKPAQAAAKPTPAVKPATLAPAAAPPSDARTVPRRQQETNDRIRDAVARATAEKDAEIARLRGAAPAQPATVTTQKAEYERFKAMPDAPQQDKYEDYGDWTIAMSAFVSDKKAEERDQAHATSERERTQRASLEDRVRAHDDTRAAFLERIDTAKAKDPAALSSINPHLQQLRPSIMLQIDPLPGEQYTVGHAVADAVLASEYPVELMIQLSDPTEAARLAGLSFPEFHRAIGRLEAQIAARQAPAAGSPTKPVTSAPAPARTLDARPAAPANPSRSAVERGDFGAFRAAEHAARRAQRA